jgi:hypothetical protein
MSVRDIDHVAEWFTEDFKLHPSIGGFRFGQEAKYVTGADAYGQN